MQSKKGFIITGIALAAITAGSFAIWMIPQNAPTNVVLSNPKDQLDSLVDQYKAISDSDKEEVDKLFSGQITADNYLGIAEISSSQIRGMIISITAPDIPGEWKSSYASFDEALKAHNTYLRETTVIAQKLKENPSADVSQDKANLEKFITQAQEALDASTKARPA
ncbi:MAG: hypothetical protein ACKOCQ_06950 [Candidatus Nitrosotenuis sp.]